jgi:hypothetical protein
LNPRELLSSLCCCPLGPDLSSILGRPALDFPIPAHRDHFTIALKILPLFAHNIPITSSRMLPVGGREKDIVLHTATA